MRLSPGAPSLPFCCWGSLSPSVFSRQFLVFQGFYFCWLDCWYLWPSDVGLCWIWLSSSGRGRSSFPLNSLSKSALLGKSSYASWSRHAGCVQAVFMGCSQIFCHSSSRPSGVLPRAIKSIIIIPPNPSWQINNKPFQACPQSAGKWMKVSSLFFSGSFSSHLGWGKWCGVPQGSIMGPL